MMGIQKWIIVAFLLILPGVCGSLLRMAVVTDHRSCENANNPDTLVKFVKELLKTRYNVSASTANDLGCTVPCGRACGPSNRKTTHKLEFDVTGSLEPCSVINVNDLKNVEYNGGFVCATNCFNDSVTSNCPNSTEGATGSQGTVSEKQTQANDTASKLALSGTQGTTTEKQTQMKDTASKSVLPLALGLSAAAAALMATAALLYRKLRKKNSVGDDSDLSNILGGSPVVQIDEAPNSVAPAGTA